MDPNQTLQEIREFIVAYNTLPDRTPEYRFAELLDDIATRFEALDGWLSTGGFLPDSWTRNRRS